MISCAWVVCLLPGYHVLDPTPFACKCKYGLAAVLRPVFYVRRSIAVQAAADMIFRESCR